jgi:LEA14-like dessication related protein
MATNKTTKFILPVLIAGGALFYYWRNLKGFLSTSTVTIPKVKFNKAETNKTLYTRLVLDLYLEVKNPAAFQGTLKGVKLDLLVNGNSLGSVNSTTTQIIQPNGTTTVIVQGSVNSLQLLGNIANVYKAIRDKKDISFRVVGDIYTSFGTNKIDVVKAVSLSDLI